MAYIGRQQSSGSFIKLDDISSQFNNSKVTFDLKVGGQPFFAVNPLTTLTIGTRTTAHTMDLHGRSMAVTDRSGTVHPIAFNLA